MTPLLSAGNSTEAPTGQLHLFLSDQARTENHQVSAPAEGKPSYQISLLKWPCPYFPCCHSFCVCLFRSCWPAVKKVKERSRTAWRWCSVCLRKPTMPCTSLCWKVEHTSYLCCCDLLLFVVSLSSIKLQLFLKQTTTCFLKNFHANIPSFSQVLTKTSSPRASSFSRTPSRSGIQKPWSVRVESATSSSLRCLLSSARRSRTQTAGANTSTRANSL